MNRRQKSESDWRERFIALGLDEQFEFIRRDWNSDHGKKALFKCRSCGETFSTWAFHEIIRERQSRLICPQCGIASDGNNIFLRSEQTNDIANFYSQGHSVKETSDKFNVSIAKVNSLVKKRRITNGKDFKQRGKEINEQRHAESENRLKHLISQGEIDYKKACRKHWQKALWYGRPYDVSITLKRLIERNGLRCAICGEMCDLNDFSRNGFAGARHPSIDHIIPLSKGGDHVWDNVQVTHIICNEIKGDKLEEEA